MKKIWIIILFIITSSLVYGEVIVKFIDGNFELQQESLWIDLKPGDSIPRGSVLRVGENSIVELSGGKAKFFLTNPGIYSIDSLLINSARSTKTKSLIFNIINRLFGNQPTGAVSGQSSVLGVRASEVPDSGFSWTNDEYAEYLELGKEYLKQGNYAEAKISFTDALDNSFDDFEEGEAMFFLSYTEAVSGDIQEAINLLKDYSPDPDAYYYEQAVLLKANLLIDTFNADKALLWINTHKAQVEDSTGSLLLLEGLGNLQLGNIEKAQNLFQNVIDFGYDQESAAIAAEYLDSM